MLRKLQLLSAGALCLAGLAVAEPIDDVVISGRYSINGIGENRTAVAVKKNYSNGTVLVRYDDNGRTAWVNSSRLLQSYGDSFSEDAAETVVWGALAVGALCYMVEDCREEMERSSASSSSGSSSSGRSQYASSSTSGSNKLYFENGCGKAVKIKFVYKKPGGEWDTRGLRWGFDAWQDSYPTVDDDKIWVSGDNVFIYAYSTDGSSKWSATSSDAKDDTWKHPQTGEWYKRASTSIDSQGDRVVKLTCN